MADDPRPFVTGNQSARIEQTFPAELLIWLSPIFPIGAFAYSQGLEAAVAHGDVTEAASLESWLRASTRHGALRNDMIVLAVTARSRTSAEVIAIAELASALQPSRERYDEAMLQGTAFWSAYAAAWADQGQPGGAGRTRTMALALEVVAGTGGRMTLPVAVGLAAGNRGIAPDAALPAYAAAFHANLVSAAIRLGVIGQVDGQRVLAALMPDIRDATRIAATATPDDLGGCTFAVDLASLEHETQATRLFRS